MKLCEFCQEKPTKNGGRFCHVICRQAAWRLRKLGGGKEFAVGPGAPPGRFCYADPPYPGTSAKYYRHEASYGGEVNFPELIQSLIQGDNLGWALSTSGKSLRELLPLCPEGTRVLPWVKPIGVPPATRGLHNAWEPVLIYGGRLRRPGVRDFLIAQPARRGGKLPGRKPLAFCAWLFQCLGMQPGDELVDLFPGTGIVSRAWQELSRQPAPDPAQLDLIPRVVAAAETSRVDERR